MTAGAEEALVAFVGLLFLVPVLCWCGYVGWLARKRGYSFLLWALVSFLASYFVAIFFLLSLPDRRQQARFQSILARIRKEARTTPPPLNGQVTLLNDATIGDLSTVES